MKNIDQKQINRIGDNLYNKFGKPLEKDHWGKYIAVSKDGKIVISADLIDVFKKSESFHSQSYIFKVGEKAVYKWRRLKK